MLTINCERFLLTGWHVLYIRLNMKQSTSCIYLLAFWTLSKNLKISYIWTTHAEQTRTDCVPNSASSDYLLQRITTEKWNLSILAVIQGSPGADITMCSENTLFTHNVACQAVFTYCLHVPAAVSISALSGELLCLLQRAVNSGVTDLLINGHRLVIRWSLNLSGWPVNEFPTGFFWRLVKVDSIDNL